ncbi:MAG: immunity 53 family protein [Nitrospiraceae bacterium]|nr:immunity 53 family protein [Nitrospiraceae bacterium]
MKNNIISELQRWYASNCDGEWEEECGIKIETLDNPGWSVIIDLNETNLEGRIFDEINNHEYEDSWLDCRVEDKTFKGFGDPSKLEAILQIFIDWAKSQNEDWLRPPPPLSEEEQKKIENDNFWNALGDEIGPELCKHENCNRKRIQHSVMCKQHHFEMITGQKRI